METRKLQKLKGGSFIISLPKEWIAKCKLKSGDQITISEEDSSLKLFPTTKNFGKPLEVTLSLEEYPNLHALRYCVITYYIQGIDRINIVSEKIIPAEKKRQIKQFRAELPGVEIAEEEANKITLHVIVDPTVFPLKSLIEKMFAFSLKLQEDAIKSLVNLDIPLATEVLERSSEAQRNYRFIIRLVALSAFNQMVAKKIGVKNCQDSIHFALVVRDLSRLIYHSSAIVSHVLSLKGKNVHPEVLNLMEKLSKATYKMQKNAMESFLKKDVGIAIGVFGGMGEIREMEKAVLKKVMEKITDIDLAVTLSMIARDTRRIAGHAVAVADDVMNRILRP